MNNERTRRVLIVHAHPEPTSLNAALKDTALAHLQQRGHEVIVSDLYAMGWKSLLDTGDFLEHAAGQRLDVIAASHHAFTTGTQSSDIATEQEKLRWADALILQFPLWWYTLPAIMKGWVERVYAYGFAYGVGEHSDRHWGDRFGEGIFAGKRAMVSVTTGGWEPHYGTRGINGPIDDLLFHIQHGMLHYPGFDVLPPFVVYRTGKMNPALFAQTQDALRARLDALWTQAPIAYRSQNGGDYEIPSLTLKAGREKPDQSGFNLHIAKD